MASRQQGPKPSPVDYSSTQAKCVEAYVHMLGKGEAAHSTGYSRTGSITAGRVGREAALCGYSLVSIAMLTCITAATLDTDGLPICYACCCCSTTADLHREILLYYPRLNDGGGYEFLRTDEKNRKYLTCIPPPSGGYTTTYLKSVVHQAKLYIRPLQQNLDLTPAPEDVNVCVCVTTQHLPFM